MTTAVEKLCVRLNPFAVRFLDAEQAILVRVAAFVKKNTRTKAQRRRFTFLMIAIAACMSVFIVRSPAHGAGFDCGGTWATSALGTTLNRVDASMALWPARLISTLTVTFYAVFGASMMFAWVNAVGSTAGQVHNLAFSLFNVAMRYGLASAAFIEAPIWGPGLINGIIGSMNLVTGGGAFPASAWSAIDPQTVWDYGSCVVNGFDQGATTLGNVGIDFGSMMGSVLGVSGGVNPLTAIINAIDIAIAELGVYLAFGIATIAVVLVRIEIPIVLAIGSILCLGFAAPDLFMGFPMKFIGAIVGLGAKVAGLCILLSVIAINAPEWATEASTATAAGDMASVLGIAVIALCLGLATFLIPQILGTLGGSPAMTFGSAVAAATTVYNTASNVTKNVSGGGGGGGSNGSGGGGGRSNSGGNSNAGGGRSNVNTNTLTAP